ncbi:MAG: 5-dehydro-4-deoxy-D-glucuronate isomerase [Flaviaesturariibacter sp.]|nr:5-dehydro-4-deoxy-D-glucuronate isomerase [Flaviaesturariibacter sp.]
MKTLYSVHPEDFKAYQTERIRERFLLDSLVKPGGAEFVYTHYDRMIVGAASPSSSEVILENDEALKAASFLERREMGVINVGAGGTIRVGDRSFALDKLDCLYIGRGETDISFSSNDASQPAVFFILSAPAHATYPTSLLKAADATPAALGSKETSNERTIYKYIHKDGIQSCQLVMGLTILQPGSVWNTMPPHTHDRRMEAYFYFDVPETGAVFHYMGQPGETRHVLVKNYDAVVSPPWSIHAGSGTSNYGFIWGMAGENMAFTDMDAIDIRHLR